VTELPLGLIVMLVALNEVTVPLMGRCKCASTPNSTINATTDARTTRTVRFGRCSMVVCDSWFGYLTIGPIVRGLRPLGTSFSRGLQRRGWIDPRGSPLWLTRSCVSRRMRLDRDHLQDVTAFATTASSQSLGESAERPLQNPPDPNVVQGLTVKINSPPLEFFPLTILKMNA
jgi:hypothetical protein